MDEKVVQVEGKYYRATDHIEEVLRRLLKYPDVKISFFSGGEKSRNLLLLRSLKIDQNRTAEDIADHIFNRDDLTVISEDKNLRFEERNKKEVEKLIPDFDPKNAILIDDKPRFVNEGVSAVSSFGTTTFTKNFDQSRVDVLHFPKSRNFWQQERDKALLWMNMIDQAMSRPAGQSFSQWLQKIWANRKAKMDSLQTKKILGPLRCPKIYLSP